MTLVDFEQAGYLELLQQHPDAEYADLGKILWQAKDSALADGRSGAARALKLLSGICSMRIVPAE